MDNSVENPPIKYDIKSLTRAVEQLRTIPQIGDLTEDQLDAIDLAASFLTDTIGTLQKQNTNRAERRRQEARARRSGKRDNRKKRRK